jgi:3-hydroxybutyryl-CoA dehydrogenase
MALVEVVPGPHTAEETIVRAMDFARSIGKTPVRLAPERYGFIANRVLFIAIQEAMRLVQDGHISVEDCDLAVRNALGWPMGPFALSDLVGLDVVEAILDEGLRQTGDARWEPVPMLRDLVASGRLGNKTGGGFLTPGSE